MAIEKIKAIVSWQQNPKNMVPLNLLYLCNSGCPHSVLIIMHVIKCACSYCICYARSYTTYFTHAITSDASHHNTAASKTSWLLQQCLSLTCHRFSLIDIVTRLSPGLVVVGGYGAQLDFCRRLCSTDIKYIWSDVIIKKKLQSSIFLIWITYRESFESQNGSRCDQRGRILLSQM